MPFKAMRYSFGSFVPLSLTITEAMSSGECPWDTNAMRNSIWIISFGMSMLLLSSTHRHSWDTRCIPNASVNDPGCDMCSWSTPICERSSRRKSSRVAPFANASSHSSGDMSVVGCLKPLAFRCAELVDSSLELLDESWS